jgi:ArsR family transcriptional regulator
MNARATPCDHDPHDHASHPPLVSDARRQRAVAMFRAAGDPARLLLLERMLPGEICVSELAACTGEGLSTVSQRLRVLLQAGLVERRRDHRHIYYRLSCDHVRELLTHALDHTDEP